MVSGITLVTQPFAEITFEVVTGMAAKHLAACLGELGRLRSLRLVAAGAAA